MNERATQAEHARARTKGARRLRVLLILPDLSGGGAERTTLNLQQHLDPARYEVEIALLEARGEYLSAAPEAHWIAPRAGFLQRMALRSRPDSLARALPQVLLLRSLVTSRRPDVVMSSMADVSVPLAFAWKLMPGLRRRTRWLAREGNNTAVVLRETFARPFLRRLVQSAIAKAYRRADAVIVTSQGVAADLAERFGLKRDKLVVIGNPVDAAAIQDAVRETPAIALPDRFIVAVGRLARQKGFDLLLRAFAALDAPDLHLVVLGKGPEEQALRSLAESLGVGDRVHLPGFLANPWPVVALAKAFCLSSRWEGFGHVVVEAMACGTPVVVSGCPHGPGEIVRNGIDGLVVAPDDWRALQAGLAEVLRDPEAAARRAVAARLRAGDFAANRIARAYAGAFEGARG